LDFAGRIWDFTSVDLCGRWVSAAFDGTGVPLVVDAYCGGGITMTWANEPAAPNPEKRTKTEMRPFQGAAFQGA
jgi:hypothetical protein